MPVCCLLGTFVIVIAPCARSFGVCVPAVSHQRAKGVVVASGRLLLSPARAPPCAPSPRWLPRIAASVLVSRCGSSCRTRPDSQLSGSPRAAPPPPSPPLGSADTSPAWHRENSLQSLKSFSPWTDPCPRAGQGSARVVLTEWRLSQPPSPTRQPPPLGILCCVGARPRVRVCLRVRVRVCKLIEPWVKSAPLLAVWGSCDTKKDFNRY